MSLLDLDKIKIWNSYIGQYGVEPTDITQLLTFANSPNDPDQLSFIQAVDILNQNKGKGIINVNVNKNNNILDQKDIDNKAVNQINYQSQINQYELLSNQNPNDIEIHLRLAATYHFIGQTTAAENTYIKCLCIDPFHVQSIKCLLVLYRELGQWSIAQKYSKELVAKYPSNAEYNAEYAVIMYRLKMYNDALIYSRKATELIKSTKYHRLYLYCLVALKMWNEAHLICEKMIKNTKNCMVRVQYLRILKYQKKYVQGKLFFDKLEMKYKSDAKCINAFSELLMDNKEYGLSLKYVKKAKELKPNNKKYWRNYINVLGRMNKKLTKHESTVLDLKSFVIDENNKDISYIDDYDEEVGKILDKKDYKMNVNDNDNDIGYNEDIIRQLVESNVGTYKEIRRASLLVKDPNNINSIANKVVEIRLSALKEDINNNDDDDDIADNDDNIADNNNNDNDDDIADNINDDIDNYDDNNDDDNDNLMLKNTKGKDIGKQNLLLKNTAGNDDNDDDNIAVDNNQNDNQNDDQVGDQNDDQDDQDDQQNDQQIVKAKDVDVKMWLKQIKMNQYTDIFLDNGFEFIDDIADITDEDLKEIGVNKLGHRKRILKFAKELKIKNIALPQEGDPTSEYL